MIIRVYKRIFRPSRTSGLVLCLGLVQWKDITAYGVDGIKTICIIGASRRKHRFAHTIDPKTSSIRDASVCEVLLAPQNLGRW